MGFKDELLPADSWEDSSRIWVFGYGSLLWKPNIKFTSQRVGYIPGFVRRFWQGNTTHRGTPDSPGRVATLIKEKSGKAWGVAYELVGHEQIVGAMGHLNEREKELGGYATFTCDFYERGSDNTSLSVLVFTATPDNHLFLGDAPLDEQAHQIVTSKGACGHNIEYITRLVKFIQENIPEDNDHHLFSLHEHILNLRQSAALQREY